MSGAAEACFVSQPSLSEQLRRLEQGLGVPLFLRTNRGLVLTDAGRLLVPRAERAVAAARDAEEAVRDAGAIVSGTVAFGTLLDRPPSPAGRGDRRLPAPIPGRAPADHQPQLDRDGGRGAPR